MEGRDAPEGKGMGLRVLMVHPHDLYAPEEPWTVRILSLARELVKRGHTVTLAYHRLGLPRDQVPEAHDGVRRLELGRHVGALPANLVRLVGLAGRCDVVHVQKCMPHAAIPALWAAYLHGIPVHYDWDDWEFRIQDIETGGKAPGWLRWMEERLPRLVDTVSVASAQLRLLALQAGVPQDRVFFTPVGADLEVFHPSVDGSQVRAQWGITGEVVLYLGQLHATQYVGQFLQAGKAVLTSHPNATLVVVGSGWRLPELKEAAKALGISHRVVFTGAVAHSQVPQYVAAADVAVACFDDNEATRAKSPLKVVEYLAAGKAVVASAVGEVKRMVEGAGVLVPPGDVEALARAVNDLLDNPVQRRELGLRARQKAERELGWGVVAQNLEEAYRKALGS